MRGRERAEAAARAAMEAKEKAEGEKVVLGRVEVNEDRDKDNLVIKKKEVLVRERVVGKSSLDESESDGSEGVY